MMISCPNFTAFQAAQSPPAYQRPTTLVYPPTLHAHRKDLSRAPHRSSRNLFEITPPCHPQISRCASPTPPISSPLIQMTTLRAQLYFPTETIRDRGLRIRVT